MSETEKAAKSKRGLTVGTLKWNTQRDCMELEPPKKTNKTSGDDNHFMRELRCMIPNFIPVLCEEKENKLTNTSYAKFFETNQWMRKQAHQEKAGLTKRTIHNICKKNRKKAKPRTAKQIAAWENNPARKRFKKGEKPAFLTKTVVVNNQQTVVPITDTKERQAAINAQRAKKIAKKATKILQAKERAVHRKTKLDKVRSEYVPGVDLAPKKRPLGTNAGVVNPQPVASNLSLSGNPVHTGDPINSARRYRRGW
jgi:hypothetical protein